MESSIVFEVDERCALYVLEIRYYEELLIIPCNNCFFSANTKGLNVIQSSYCFFTIMGHTGFIYYCTRPILF